MSDQEICQFCGTGINPGAVVCVGCGANSKFEVPFFKGVLGTISGLFGAASAMVVYEAISKKEYIMLICLPLALAGVYGAMKCFSNKKKNWYRSMH